MVVLVDVFVCVLQSEDSGPQGESSPAKYMALSPLLIPVSVPVTTDPNLAYKEREDSTHTPDVSTREPLKCRYAQVP